MNRSVEWNRVVVPLTAVVAMALMVVSIGCERPDWEDPEYVAEKLEEGRTAERANAVEQLRHYPEDQRDDIAGIAAEVYLEDDQFRSDIMRQLIQWREPGAKAAYIEELKEDHTGYASSAAEVLGQIGAVEAIDDMIEVFEQTSDSSRQIGILRGFSHMPDSKAIDKAVEVFELDVDNYPIDLHRAACDFIGGLALDEPDAIDEQIRQQLVYARFLASEDGRTTGEACGLAIQRVGLDMTPHLIELFEGENEDVQRLLMTYDDPSGGEHFPQNLSKVRAAEHLAALRAPEAVEVFTDELESTIGSPDVDGDAATEWLRNEAQATNEMMRGLGDIGDPQARGVLEQIVQGELFADEWEQIMGLGPSVGFQMLQDSARALYRLGDREARSTLLEMTDAEIFPPMARQFRALEEMEEREAPPMVEQLRPQWLAAKSFAYLGEADDRDEIATLADEIEDDDLSEKLESFLAAFDVMDECGDVDDDDERAGCLEGFLDDDREHARHKAILELSRMPHDAAAPVIAEAITNEDLDLRELVTFAGYRRPSETLADNIDELLEEESARGSDQEVDHRRLRMLRAWLVHQDRDDVVAP